VDVTFKKAPKAKCRAIKPAKIEYPEEPAK